MNQVIKFGCPACGCILQIPLTGSGERGPCPRCQQLIMAPDLSTGAQAYRLILAPSPAVVPPPASSPVLPPEPPVAPPHSNPLPPQQVQPPFAEPQPSAEYSPSIAPAPAPTPASIATQAPTIAAQASPTVPDIQPEVIPVDSPTLSSSQSPSRVGLATSLSVGAIASVLAFAGGYQAGQQHGVPIPSSKGPAAVVEPQPLPLEQPPLKPTAPVAAQEKAAPSATTIGLAKAGLEAFLSAKDWKSRLPHVLAADQTGPKMEAYYNSHPDGPTNAVKISVEHCEADATTERMLVIFRVSTADASEGFPVAVAETLDGWKVDWESFSEFRDGLFHEFVSGTGKETGVFHLIIRSSSTPSALKGQIAYDLTAPVVGSTQQAFVPAGSDIANQLAMLTSNSPFATLVLSLARRTEANGKSRLDILSVSASDWRPKSNF